MDTDVRADRSTRTRPRPATLAAMLTVIAGMIGVAWLDGGGSETGPADVLSTPDAAVAATETPAAAQSDVELAFTFSSVQGRRDAVTTARGPSLRATTTRHW